MPTFDNVLVTGSQTIGQDLQVNGNETIGQNLQVNGNQTVAQSLNVNGNETIAGSLQVNGSQTIANNLGVGGTVSATGSVQAAFRLVSAGGASVPVTAANFQLVRSYPAPGVVNQPGVVLKGTDGNNYVLFVDVSGGTPTLGIQPI